MAMNKKEREQLERALTASALRATSRVLPDVRPPAGSGMSVGWLYGGESGSSPGVDVACSSSVFHGYGSIDRTNSQGCRALYSTKLLALKALRHEVELDCARRLRKIDIMIEKEEGKDA